MIVNWGDIYEIVYMSNSQTVVANAFRKAVGLAVRTSEGTETVPARTSAYDGVDWERLLGQRHGVRL